MNARSTGSAARAWLGAALAAIAITGCGGGGDDSPDASPASLVGIWSGTTVSALTGTRVKVNGVALPNGEVMFFATQDCHVFNGTHSTQGRELTLIATAQWKNYCYGSAEPFPVGWAANSTDGPKYTQTFRAAGSLTSSDSARLSYTASLGDRGAVELSYWSIYERPSSLEKLAGEYSNGPGLNVTVNRNGTFSGADLVPGLLFPETRRYSGRFTVIDPSRNVYGLDLNVDGRSMRGYAILTDSAAGKKEDAIQLAAVQTGWGPFVHYWIKR